MEKLDKKKIQGYAAEASGLDEDVTALVVQDKASYGSMLILVDLAKAFQTEIVTFFEDMKAATHEAHKIVCTQERESLAPFKLVEARAKERAGKWYLEEKRRADAEARKEQERLNVIAREKQRKETGRLREYKQVKAAQAIEDKPLDVEKVEVKSGTKGSGFTMVDNWNARIVNIDHVSRKYMIPNLVLLTKLAKDQKGENAPDGVEFFNDPYAVKRR